MSKVKTGVKLDDGQESESAEHYSVNARDVHLTYSDGTEALKGVSLQVPRGAFIGFLGQNGAGKTTFIKILVTLLKPTKGTARVNGFDVVERPQAVRESIGYLSQDTSVDNDLTARENIRFACEAYGVPRRKRKQRIEELLDLVELRGVGDKRVRGFSGGMKKRLDLATAIVHEPPLLFLDEPTTGFDPKSKKKLWNYLRRINNQGRTIFLTTQYLEEADQLCDWIAIIQDGRIIKTGEPGDLKREIGGDVLEIELKSEEEKERAANIARESDVFESEPKVKITEDGIHVASQNIRERGVTLLTKLRNSGLRITSFNLREPRLDDAFLAITGERIEESKDIEKKKGKNGKREGHP